MTAPRNNRNFLGTQKPSSHANFSHDNLLNSSKLKNDGGKSIHR
jgi:hypothetical protein